MMMVMMVMVVNGDDDDDDDLRFVCLAVLTWITKCCIHHGHHDTD